MLANEKDEDRLRCFVETTIYKKVYSMAIRYIHFYPQIGLITFFRTRFPAKACQSEKKPKSFPLS